MSSFQPNDRVVCIDATPIPINAPGSSLSDFSYPGGFIEEGQIYCVRSAHSVRTSTGLILVGLPLLLMGAICSWDSLRFRKLSSQSNSNHLSRANTRDLKKCH